MRVFSRVGVFGVFLLVLGLLSACGSSSATSSSRTSTPAQTKRSTPPPFFPTAPRGKAFTARLITDAAGLHDNSFNDLAWKGLRDAAHTYGISSSVVQPKASTNFLRDLVTAAQHYTTITFSVGYSMSHDLYQAALEFPRARFAAIDARPLDPSGAETSLPNVENLIFKEQESGYMVGVIAGLMEKQRVGRATHNTIGYLGGEAIPAVDRYLAGYVAGAQSVDPGVKILGDYAGSFTDQGAGANLARTQIRGGADILFQVASGAGLGYLQIAKTQGVYGIGVDSNQSYLGPFILTSALKRVTPVVREVVRLTEQGHYTAGDRLFGVAQRATGFAKPSHIVPASIVAQAKKVKGEIASGKIVPPTTIPGH